MMCDEVLVVQEWLRSWLPAGSIEDCEPFGDGEQWIVSRADGLGFVLNFEDEGVTVSDTALFPYSDPEFFLKLQAHIKELLG